MSIGTRTILTYRYQPVSMTIQKEKKQRKSLKLEESIIKFLESRIDGIKTQDFTSAVRAFVVDSKEYQEWKRRQKGTL